MTLFSNCGVRSSSDFLEKKFGAFDYEIFEYCKDAWLNLWLRRLFTAQLAGTLLGIFCAIFIFSAMGAFNWLYPFWMALLKFSLVPIMPLLKGSGNILPEAVWQLLNTVVGWLTFILGLGGFLTAIVYGMRPSIIAVTAQGVHLGQPGEGDFFFERGFIPFEMLTGIHLVRPEGSRSHADYEIAFEQLRQGVQTIKMGDIVNPLDRRKFLELLKERSPVPPDEELFEVFQGQSERESYTEIWLKELSAAPKRDKLTPLTSGASLQKGRYQIASKIGMGGQGTVYLASVRTGGKLLNSKNDEVVAVKEYVLPVFPDARVRKAAAEKFQDEAALLRDINHANIVRFLELFIEDHRAYLVLERAQGENLKRLIGSQGPMNEPELLKCAVQMCCILDYLHSKNPPIIHRDFTPDNLIIDSDGNLKLIDFSVAQQQELNVTGTVVGKHNYMAPEQFRGKPQTQSDIYSMGATLFYLLTGEEPEAITQLHPRRIRTEISEELDAIIARATALNTDARYQTISEMQRDLESLGQAIPSLQEQKPQRSVDHSS